MFTGGTTGVSKAAILTHGGWACCVIDTVSQLGLQASDRHAVVLPMTHAAWFTLAAHLHVGAVTHLPLSWDPKRYLELVERERLTTLHMIPTLLGDLVEVVGVHDVSSARLLTVAGSPMPLEMYRRARRVFGDILGNIYGLTEATGPVTYLLPDDMTDEKIRSGGRAGRFIEIDIRDEQEDAENAYGGVRVGEIALRGPQITPGYLNRPEETSAAFVDGWFCTGDIGYLDADGFLFILDRKKDMIKSGGFNIYPKEIEEVLYRHPSVFEAAVIGLPDPRWIEVVTAVVAVNDPSIGVAELESHCREHLSGYKVPKAIHLLAALPRTDFGKFDKKQLQHRFSA
jgi:acyl-CoA synthetase (AMP-forming)/AMP-acid ligase II